MNHFYHTRSSVDRMHPPGDGSTCYFCLDLDQLMLSVGLSDISINIEASKDNIKIGESLELFCDVSNPSAVLSWQKTGSSSIPSNVDINGQLLRIDNVRPENGGVYRCSATHGNDYNEKDFVLKISVEKRNAPQGSTVILECKTNLELPVQYSWNKQGDILPATTSAFQQELKLENLKASDAGTYVCTAKSETVAMDIPTILIVTGVVPYFAQAPISFISLPTLADAYREFDIEMSFKPESLDGLVLYNGQDSIQGGDFVSFAMADGFAEFLFDMGSGSAIMKSPIRLSVGEWHSVKLRRYLQNGSMIIDDQPEVLGRSPGTHQGLDLMEPMYLGGTRDFSIIQKQTGQLKGFVGCVSRLVISGNLVELTREPIEKNGVTTCETCAMNPCSNGGVCQEAYREEGYQCICPSGLSGDDCSNVGDACYPGACGSGRCENTDGGFQCFCPLGKSGKRCEIDLTIYEPSFTGDSYLMYPTPLEALTRTQVALTLKPQNLRDSVILYCAQTDQGKGDFFSLALRDRHLEYSFDTGSGPAVLRSKREIRKDEWITISTLRINQSASMSINGTDIVKGRSPGTSLGLNLRTPLYVGGVDIRKIKVNSNLGINDGFTGCMSKMEVEGTDLSLLQLALEGSNVEDCGGEFPCEREPCKNNGKCIDQQSTFQCICSSGFRGPTCEEEVNLCETLAPCLNNGRCEGTVDTYSCHCPKGFSGVNCEETIQFDHSAKFDGHSYVELDHKYLPHTSSMEKEIISFEFSTDDKEGLIFWHGQKPDSDNKNQDYLALAVVDGVLEFSYELGSGPSGIRSNVPVNDGKVHKVVLTRSGRDGILSVDGAKIFGTSQGALQVLNTKGNIYIGGLPNLDRMTAGKYPTGFKGCLHNFDIQGSGPVHFYDESLATVNVHLCDKGAHSIYEEKNLIE